MADKIFPSGAANTTLVVFVPAGAHNITIDSISSDWYQVNGSNFVLS
jgi:hypothetical protein